MGCNQSSAIEGERRTSPGMETPEPDILASLNSLGACPACWGSETYMTVPPRRRVDSYVLPAIGEQRYAVICASCRRARTVMVVWRACRAGCSLRDVTGRHVTAHVGGRCIVCSPADRWSARNRSGSGVSENTNPSSRAVVIRPRPGLAAERTKCPAGQTPS